MFANRRDGLAFRIVKPTDHRPLLRIEPAASAATHTRSIRVRSTREGKTQLDVPASEHAPQAVANLREALRD